MSVISALIGEPLGPSFWRIAPAVMLQTAMTPAMDRSISPAINTIVIPSATIKTTAIWRPMLRAFTTVKKYCDRIEKKIMSTASAMISGKIREVTARRMRPGRVDWSRGFSAVFT